MVRGWEVMTGSEAWEMLREWVEKYKQDVLLECKDSTSFDEKEYGRGRYDGMEALLGFVDGRVTEERRISTSADKATANARHS